MKAQPIAIPPGLRGRHPAYFAPHWNRGRYYNPWQRLRPPSVKEVWRWQVERPRFSARTRGALQMVADPLAGFRRLLGGLRVLWIGHANFLVEMDGVRLLIDPIFGRVSGVVPRKTAPGLTLGA